MRGEVCFGEVQAVPRKYKDTLFFKTKLKKDINEVAMVKVS